METNSFKPDYDGNLLYPVFFRLDKLKLLVVGGGAVGLEKTLSVFKNSPNAHVTLVAPEIRPEIIAIQSSGVDLQLVYKEFEESDLAEKNLVIAATANHELNKQVWESAKNIGILCNIADTPELCDFYLGSVVKKGDLKLGISTNGKSPTLSKRLREYFEYILPNSIQNTLDMLHTYRENLKGDFELKLEVMDKLTKGLRPEIAPKKRNQPAIIAFMTKKIFKRK